MAFEGIEVAVPQAPVGLEPFVELPERTGFDAVDALLGSGPAGHETRLAQHLEVLGHRRLADGHRGNQLADAPLAGAELVEDVPPRRLRKNGERLNSHLGSMPCDAY